MKHFKFKLLKAFPFFVNSKVYGMLPVGTVIVLELPEESILKAVGDGSIEVIEQW